ncbi:hypothetical protein D3C78_1258330 [compost metagenome]
MGAITTLREKVGSHCGLSARRENQLSPDASNLPQRLHPSFSSRKLHLVSPCARFILGGLYHPLLGFVLSDLYHPLLGLKTVARLLRGEDFG